MVKSGYNISPWISAFRLRTLPLALASIGMGSFLAAYVGNFNLKVFVLSALTTIFLQILSNLSNDYGDSVHGADHAGRQGPNRAVQSGAITRDTMKLAIIVLAIFSLVSGIYLLSVALGFGTQSFLYFLLLGLISIIAAVAYTVGKRPYGYIGLGDISVLFFFGLVGVMGTFYLHTEVFNRLIFLPALSCGFFSMAVLNLNNMRDIESDKVAGKLSIPVRIGYKKAVYYHWFLLVAGLMASLIFVWITQGSWFKYLFLISMPLLLRNAIAVHNIDNPAKLDPYLKQMAITTLIFVITFGIGLLQGL